MLRSKWNYPLFSVAAVFVLASCGGGNSSSGSDDFNRSSALSVIASYLSQLDEDVSVTIGFSAVTEKTCDILGLLPSENRSVCIRYDTNDTTTYDQSPVVSPDGVGYFLDIPSGTEEEVRAAMDSLSSKAFAPVYLAEANGSVDFGTHDINSEGYFPQGYVCVASEHPESVEMSADINGTSVSDRVYMDNNGSGCFFLPDPRSYGEGEFNVSNPLAVDGNLSTGLVGKLGDFNVTNAPAPIDCDGYWTTTSSYCSASCEGTTILRQTYTLTQPAENGGDDSCPADGSTRTTYGGSCGGSCGGSGDGDFF